jgi:hypothetical protein
VKWETGTIISGAGHAALILWVILGDWLFTRDDAPMVQVSEVSLMTSAEFDAMAAAVPASPDPMPADTPAPAPDMAQPAPVPSDAPPPTSEPEAVPDPPLPENGGVVDAEILPVVPDAPPPVAMAPTDSPRPKPAPRVAPVPVDAPDPAIDTAEAPQDAITPDPTSEPQVVQPETAPMVQEEAGTVLETEANRDEQVMASGAPLTSPRPKGRPAPAPLAERPVEAPVPTPVDDIADAIAGAVAEAVTAPDTPEPTGGTNAPQGPPITSGERDALRVAVQQCWNVGSLSSDALQTTVILAVSVAETGIPDAGSIRMISSTGGTEAGARGAFETARRAIIRCGARGFPLPPEKYEQWRELELVFNPDGMRMR